MTGFEVRGVRLMVDTGGIFAGEVLDSNSDAALEVGRVDLYGVVVMVHSDSAEGVHGGACTDFERGSHDEVLGYREWWK